VHHRILVIEDDPEIQYLLTAILGTDEREIVTTATGADAEAALEDGHVDLVVLDLILPDMDGRTILSRMRERPETATVPVVVVSARGGTQIRQDVYGLGADHFVEKPFDPDGLAADVAARLARSSSRDIAALHDSTTGLLNRAGLAQRYQERAGERAVALLQLDAPTGLSDAGPSERWDAQETEKALGSVADDLRAHVGPDADIARVGGGEFVCVAESAHIARLTADAESVLQAIRGRSFTGADGEPLELTASIGVVSVKASATLDEALAEARRRLFRAREAGRNRVVSEDEESDLSHARVLVAEDDEISATILLHRLDKEGLDVVHFDNGREAYEAALATTPDLVILDVKMPGMDGFEVLEGLRKIPSYENTPIILLTSMGREADVVRGFELGADDYVLKPFSPVELSARVWRLLRRGRSPAAI